MKATTHKREKHELIDIIGDSTFIKAINLLRAKKSKKIGG